MSNEQISNLTYLFLGGLSLFDYVSPCSTSVQWVGHHWFYGRLKQSTPVWSRVRLCILGWNGSHTHQRHIWDRKPLQPHSQKNFGSSQEDLKIRCVNRFPHKLRSRIPFKISLYSIVFEENGVGFDKPTGASGSRPLQLCFPVNETLSWHVRSWPGQIRRRRLKSVSYFLEF
jgi:hypothetical protein